MKKTELVQKISASTGLKQKEVAAVINTLLDEMSLALQKEEEIRLSRFGTFETKLRAARVGKNPKTGETVKIPACKVPAFKPGKVLKESVR